MAKDIFDEAKENIDKSVDNMKKAGKMFGNIAKFISNGVMAIYETAKDKIEDLKVKKKSNMI